MTLHLAKGTVALASHIALEEIGAPFDLVWVDFRAGEQRSDEYARINPKGRVPVLTTPHGRLTETPAILNWLAATHPAAGLWPDDAFQRARIDEMSAFLASTMHVNHAHRMRGARWADRPESLADMAAKVPETMAAAAALVEKALPDGGPWVLGDRYSTADMHLFTVSSWLEGDSVEITDFPRLSAHADAMRARPAVQRTWALHQPGA
nr:glutathione S-transferase family protein [Oceaniglobus indicus]